MSSVMSSQQYADTMMLLLHNELYLQTYKTVSVKRPPPFVLKTKPRIAFDRFKTSTREGIVFVVCVAAVIGMLLL